MCLLQNKLKQQDLIDKNSSSQDLYFVYVLKLENNKYYVGKTKNLQKRLESHRQGTTVFTRKYNSVKLIECIRTNMKYMENNLYFKYVEKYGIDNVRGDIFSRETLAPIDIYYIKKIMRNENNDCFACGGDHFINQCSKKSNTRLYDIDQCLIQLQKFLKDCNIPYDNDDQLIKQNCSLIKELNEIKQKTLWNHFKDVLYEFYEDTSKFFSLKFNL